MFSWQNQFVGKVWKVSALPFSQGHAEASLLSRCHMEAWSKAEKAGKNDRNTLCPQKLQVPGKHSQVFSCDPPSFLAAVFQPCLRKDPKLLSAVELPEVFMQMKSATLKEGSDKI